MGISAQGLVAQGLQGGEGTERPWWGPGDIAHAVRLGGRETEKPGMQENVGLHLQSTHKPSRDISRLGFCVEIQRPQQ